MFKYLASLPLALLCAAFAFAQCPSPAPSGPPQAKPATFQSFPSSFTPAAAPAADRSTQEEVDFLANGPKLYDMPTALKVSKLTGKPVVCWVGSHIFSEPKARTASAALGDTTIQAVMKSDGETIDKNGKPIPALRVKFTDNNYAGGKTAYVPVAKLNEDSPAKILAFVRGSGR